MTYQIGESLLKIDNVCLNYDGKPILRNVCAEIKDIIVPGKITGQIVGFLGPSGIGKTQLFRIISGLNKPTSGMVSINGSDKPVQAGQIGVVAQSYPLFEHRTVLSNLMLASCQKESDNKIARDRVMAYMEEFELIDHCHAYPSQLSGGQRQRCAIIQQVLCSEHFLLMDEPFSGLDLPMLDKTCVMLQKIANLHELNTIVVVTHDIAAAATIADHLWLMGRETGVDGAKLPGARIMKEFDLIERNLAWHPGIANTEAFSAFVREVKDEFRKL